MIIFKCKMCGGDLNPAEGATTCECEYCGSVQTIPTADNEKKGNLFNRANRLRMAAEYDKAGTVYASITAEFPEEAEAYWGLCLCKYGIEYVEDPATAKKIPTCHRTRSESIMDDPDFEQACENADAIARRVYREEAKAIDRLQQDILSVVANESPYDVFICYKETGEDGERTEDSVLGQDIYDALTAKGLKVFFARITLEDKLGQQYEPYIYAALHSAKVMLAVGTQFEYYDAVWVKNEWARFLDMMKSDKTKTLIPCYKGIDAYDMPREFKNLQAQDMGKLGWLQDLTRGVMKLCEKDGSSKLQTATNNTERTENAGIQNLLERAFVFLEDEDWDKAHQYADRVLDIDFQQSRAYIVKLLADLHIQRLSDLINANSVLERNPNYSKVIRYGDEILKKQIKDIATKVKEKGEAFRIKARECMEAGDNASATMYYEKLLKKFPDDWEAVFFLTYSKCQDTISVPVGSQISNAMKSAFSAIKKEISDLDEQDNMFMMVAEKVNDILSRRVNWINKNIIRNKKVSGEQRAKCRIEVTRALMDLANELYLIEDLENASKCYESAKVILRSGKVDIPSITYDEIDSEIRKAIQGIEEESNEE